MVRMGLQPGLLVEATPSGYKETARAQPLGGKCWTMPVVSNGRIYGEPRKAFAWMCPQR